jgi:hypothetical protein
MAVEIASFFAIEAFQCHCKPKESKPPKLENNTDMHCKFRCSRQGHSPINTIGTCVSFDQHA